LRILRAARVCAQSARGAFSALDAFRFPSFSKPRFLRWIRRFLRRRLGLRFQPLWQRDPRLSCEGQQHVDADDLQRGFAVHIKGAGLTQHRQDACEQERTDPLRLPCPSLIAQASIFRPRRAFFGLLFVETPDHQDRAALSFGQGVERLRGSTGAGIGVGLRCPGLGQERAFSRPFP
jgi:hypothetical protein